MRELTALFERPVTVPTNKHQGVTEGDDELRESPGESVAQLT